MFIEKQLLCFLLLYFTIGANAQNTLVIQSPGGCTKEAMIWRLDDQQGTFGSTNSTNFSNLDYWPVMNWTWEGSPGQRFVLFDFLDGFTIPSDVQITAAHLSLFSPESSSDGFHSLETDTGKPSIASIQLITEDWELNSVTWDNQPSTTTDNQLVLAAPMDDQQDYLDIDVTSLLQAQVNGPSPGFGLLMRMQETDYYRKLIFASSNNENVDLRPRLVLEYTGSTISLTSSISNLIVSDEVAICVGDQVELEAVVSDQLSQYEWSTGEMTPTISVAEAGLYQLTAMVNNCYEITDTVTVLWIADCSETITCEVYLPNIFSPNEDGTNDGFRPFFPADCSLSGFEMEIFNRWGQAVFSTKDPFEAWRGWYKGSTAPAGVYVYKVQYEPAENQSMIVKAGEFTLVR